MNHAHATQLILFDRRPPFAESNCLEQDTGMLDAFVLKR
jgi:hypothetical protein